MKRLLPLVLLLVPTLAFAEKGGGKRSPAELADRVMKRLDTNKDGRISRDEAKAGPRIEKHFDRIDADRDGFVAKAELVSALEKLQKRREQQRDRGDDF
jgi:Ca2+-binding EF-hand superfamily protein